MPLGFPLGWRCVPRTHTPAASGGPDGSCSGAGTPLVPPRPDAGRPPSTGSYLMVAILLHRREPNAQRPGGGERGSSERSSPAPRGYM
eukprot:scaffold2364_cov426-Prasinococcus_capsulatus_cf.AAC.10